MQRAAARVAHLHLPTLKTASSALPWTFLFPHLVLPVWQETAGQLTRHRHTPAAPRAFMETYTCFDSELSPLLYDVLLWPAVALILGPHFIPLLPVGAVVPAGLSRVGGPWNSRSCWVWLSSHYLLAPDHWRSIPPCFQFIDKRDLCCANVVRVVMDPSGDMTPPNNQLIALPLQMLSLTLWCHTWVFV